MAPPDFPTIEARVREAGSRSVNAMVAAIRKLLQPNPIGLHRGRLRHWSRVGLASGLLGVGVVLSAAVCSYVYYENQFVPPSEVGVNQSSAGAKILDRAGNLLYQYLDDREGLRVPILLEGVSPHLKAATIATEDASFYNNPGVNPKGMLRALWENFNPLSGDFLDGSGGSSITQQLVKNLYIPAGERADRSWRRKAQEAVYAVELTNRYDKDQILEWYLNQISYGGVFNGVESASRGYFSKSAGELTLAEAALLAGLPQAPAAYSPFLEPEAALSRRNEVLDLMARHQQIQIGPNDYYTPSPQEIETAKQTPLSIKPQPFPIEAPHFVLSYVQSELEARFGRDALYRDGLVVTTSLDLQLQESVAQAMEGRISEFESASNSHNGAVVVIDARTGEMLVMLGSRDYWREDIQGQNNNATALNSPGSAFKPFVYLTAFQKLGWGPGTHIEDTPVTYRNPDGTTFQPRNPTGTYHGTVTIRNALGNSLNASAFKTAIAVGVPDIVATGRKMGITTLSGNYGPAIAIGGVDVTALDLTYAYAGLANGGVLAGQRPVKSPSPGDRETEPVAVLKVTDADGKVRFDVASQRLSRRVASAEHAFMVTSVLTDPRAQCLTFGCGGLAVPGVVMAIKTGTSEPFDSRGPDAGKIGETWSFGYTPDVAIGVWAGNADNSAVTNITSTTIAFRTLRDVALAYFEEHRLTAFAQPDALVRGRACGSNSAEDLVLRSGTQLCNVRTVEDPRKLEEQQKKALEDQRKALEEQRKKAEEQLKKALEEQRKRQEEQRKRSRD